jgi:hypothetical protein
MAIHFILPVIVREDTEALTFINVKKTGKGIGQGLPIWENLLILLMMKTVLLLTMMAKHCISAAGVGKVWEVMIFSNLNMTLPVCGQNQKTWAIPLILLTMIFTL